MSAAGDVEANDCSSVKTTAPTVLAFLLFVHSVIFTLVTCVALIGCAVYSGALSIVILGGVQLLFGLPGYYGCYHTDKGIIRVFGLIAILLGLLEVGWAIYAFMLWRPFPGSGLIFLAIIQFTFALIAFVYPEATVHRCVARAWPFDKRGHEQATGNSESQDPTWLCLLLLLHFAVFSLLTCAMALGSAVTNVLIAVVVMGVTQLLFGIPGYYACYHGYAGLIRVYGVLAIIHGAAEIGWAIFGLVESNGTIVACVSLIALALLQFGLAFIALMYPSMLASRRFGKLVPATKKRWEKLIENRESPSTADVSARESAMPAADASARDTTMIPAAAEVSERDTTMVSLRSTRTFADGADSDSKRSRDSIFSTDSSTKSVRLTSETAEYPADATQTTFSC